MVASKHTTSVVERDDVQVLDNMYLVQSDVVRALRLNLRSQLKLPTDSLDGPLSGMEIFVLFRICHSIFNGHTKEHPIGLDRCRGEFLDYVRGKGGLPYAVTYMYATRHPIFSQTVAEGLIGEYVAACGISDAPLLPMERALGTSLRVYRLPETEDEG
jgi:hypothetical protein